MLSAFGAEEKDCFCGIFPVRDGQEDTMRAKDSRASNETQPQARFNLTMCERRIRYARPLMSQSETYAW